MDMGAFYKIPCGMYIVSTAHGGKLNGQVVNAIVQVASQPPQIAVSLNKQNLTCDLCSRSGVFTVSVLDQDAPMTFLGRFGFKSGRDLEKFEGINYKIGKSGAPIVLDHALAYFEAEVVTSIDIGTHLVLIGRVTDAEVIRDVEPMSYAYYRTVKKGLTSKLAASYQEKPKEEGARREAQPQANEVRIGKDDRRSSGGARPTAGDPVSVPALAVPLRYRCNACGYVYDPAVGIPESGIKPGTAFEALPGDWKCPVCGVGKDRFTALPP